MNRQQINKLDDLTLDLNMELSILNSAVMGCDDDLQVSNLVNFIERTYKLSTEIRNIFETTLL